MLKGLCKDVHRKAWFFGGHYWNNIPQPTTKSFGYFQNAVLEESFHYITNWPAELRLLESQGQKVRGSRVQRISWIVWGWQKERTEKHEECPKRGVLDKGLVSHLCFFCQSFFGFCNIQGAPEDVLFFPDAALPASPSSIKEEHLWEAARRTLQTHVQEFLRRMWANGQLLAEKGACAVNWRQSNTLESHHPQQQQKPIQRGKGLE